MTTKLGRHKGIEVTCEWCGTKFVARKSRVKEGKGRFCSRPCGNKGKVIPKKIGIEYGKVYKSGDRCIVRWYDDEGRQRSSAYGKWQWEQMYGKGSIPKGYRVGFVDGNPLNALPENLHLLSPKEYGREQGKRMEGVPKSNSHRQALSKSHMGKALTQEHKDNISNSNREKWAKGVYDKVHKGKYNKHYKEGYDKPYPPEFYEIKFFIKSRDNHVCQICGKDVYRSKHGHVHHIDGDKMNNVQENLILLCSSCHSKVHHIKKTSPLPILALNSKLKY